MVILSLALFCCTGCVEEQPTNLSECINNSLTEPISRTDAVIVALADPEVVAMVENYSFHISVGTGSSPEARDEALKEFYSVRIDRYDLATHVQTTSLLVAVTFDGRVDHILWEPPPRGPVQPRENITADTVTAAP